MRKIIFGLIILLFLLTLALGALVYFYYAFVLSSGISEDDSQMSSQAREAIIGNKTKEEAIGNFSDEYVTSLVYAIGASRLHNPPLSKDTPKIGVMVDEEIYFSEIISGKVHTKKEPIENEDIVIITSKSEIVDLISSEDAKSYIKDSVQNGRIVIEIKAGNTKLYSKGYLKIYEDITGEKFSDSFTGSIIRIFK